MNEETFKDRTQRYFDSITHPAYKGQYQAENLSNQPYRLGNDRVANINAEIASQGNKGYSVAPSVISSNLLSNNQNPLTLPETTSATSQTAGASVQGITEGLNQSSLASIQQEQDLKAQQAKAQVDSSTSKVQGLIDKLMGKGQAQIQAEEQAGISQKTQELTNITNEYNTKSLEYRRMEEAVMKESMLTDVQKNARLRQISREKNTELADIGIKQAVAQNNLKTAQDLVDRKIDLEYGDLKDVIGFQQSFLEMNREDLSKAEQNALNLRITENTRKYEEGKSIGEFAKSVAANGADAATISRVTNAKTMAEAVQAAGQFAGDTLERQIKQAQLANIYSQIAERNAQGTGIESSNLLAYAQQYASTGVIPTGLPKGTFGAVAQTAKELPKQNGAVVNATTGIADSKTPATEQADYSRLYNIIKNVQRLKQLDEERIGGIVSGTLGKLFGADKQSEYLATRKAIVDDMQRMQSGAALTPAETSFYEGYLPGRFSEPLGLGQDSAKKISNFETIMTNRLNERLAANGLSIYGYSKVNTPVGEFTVGDVIEVNGVMGRINPDGSVTKLSQ